MTKHKKLTYLTSIIILLIVSILSGCITGDGNPTVTRAPEASPSYTYGLKVTDFSSLGFVESGESIEIGIDMENVGDSNAKNINAVLFQTSGFSKASGPSPSSIDILQPPEIAYNIPGEKANIYWNLIAPEIQTNQIKSLLARIFYDYSSKSTTNIYLVPKNEWDEYGPESFETSSTSSIGPIMLSIVPLPAIKVYGENINEKKVDVYLTIKNTGNGKVDGGELTNFKMIVADHTIIPVCEDVHNGKITLFGTKGERSITCTLTLPFDDIAVSYIIEASADYRYYFDAGPLELKVKSK